MDPEATLNAAQANLAAGKKASGWRAMQAFAQAGERLEDYWGWRRRGGFEPPKGDRRAEDIAEELSESWEEESDRVERDRAEHGDYFENPGAPTGDLVRRLIEALREENPDRLTVTADSEEEAERKARKFGRVLHTKRIGPRKFVVSVSRRNNPDDGVTESELTKRLKF